MSKFEVGQEVIFSHGDLKDVKGVVLNPHFQISQSDWPEVVVQYGDNHRFFVDMDKVRPAEDPYEYGATWASPFADEPYFPYFEIFENEWGTLEEAKQSAQEAESVGNTDIKIMRRLKAGEPEDYNV